MLIDEFLCKREVLGKRAPHSFTPPLSVVGVSNHEMRGHMLKVEFLTLEQKTFDNLQYFFTKYKDLLSQLKACGVDKSKEEKQLVLTILSKLGPKYSVFVSTFHSVRLTSGST
jgi:hypothetical protein